MLNLMLQQRTSGVMINNAHFFNIRVCNPFVPSYHDTSMENREIEHGSFSLLVFSTTGGMGTIATVVYKQLASVILEKYEKP